MQEPRQTHFHAIPGLIARSEDLSRHVPGKEDLQYLAWCTMPTGRELRKELDRNYQGLLEDGSERAKFQMKLRTRMAPPQEMLDIWAEMQAKPCVVSATLSEWSGVLSVTIKMLYL
jgi:hypothetical protein